MVTERPTQGCETHYWMLPSPGGPTSTGTCKHCGAEKEFSNSTGRTWVPRTAAKQKSG
jgi:hypothetical protein